MGRETISNDANLFDGCANNCAALTDGGTHKSLQPIGLEPMTGGLEILSPLTPDLADAADSALNPDYLAHDNCRDTVSNGVKYTGHALDAALPLAANGEKPNLVCYVCVTPFYRKRVRYDRSDRHCCSPRCTAVLANAASHENFKTPESTKAERVRANGIVNRRLALGWFNKPATCCLCGEPHRRISAHHQSYKAPISVHWLDPGCHLRVHHNPALLDGIPPFICDRKLPPRINTNFGEKGLRGLNVTSKFRGMKMSEIPEAAKIRWLKKSEREERSVAALARKMTLPNRQAVQSCPPPLQRRLPLSATALVTEGVK